MAFFTSAVGVLQTLVIALGAGLGTMVDKLSSQKAGWDDRCEEFSDWD